MKNCWILGFSMIGLMAGCTKSGKNEESKMSGASVKNPIVEITTSQGKIALELDANKAPKTVENFLAYVDAGFYTGTIFHRVIDGFMIQGGGFSNEMQQKATNAPVENEAANGYSNAPMTIAMARTNDPNSATAQFFINLADNKRLDYSGPSNPGYAAFGKVIEGEDIVRKIGKMKTTNKMGFSDVPAETVIIESAARRQN